MVVPQPPDPGHPRALPRGDFPVQQAAARGSPTRPAGCDLDLWLLYYAAAINIARPQTGRVGDATSGLRGIGIYFQVSKQKSTVYTYI
jgi:hypothetical protein